MNNPYLIESIEHRWDDNVTWWKPNRCGYTQNLAEAGRYSKEEAKAICDKANAGGTINERMWRECEVLHADNAEFSVMTCAVYK